MRTLSESSAGAKKDTFTFFRTPQVTVDGLGILFFDRDVWYDLYYPDCEMLKVTSGGSKTKYPLVPSQFTRNCGPQDLALGSDGAIWYADYLNGVGRMTTSGNVTGYFLNASANFLFSGITTGPDKNIWFTMDNDSSMTDDEIGQISVKNGEAQTFDIPNSVSEPIEGIAAGADGNLWFAAGNQYGKMTTSGVVTQYTLPPNNGVNWIIAGPNKTLWAVADGFLGYVYVINTQGKVLHTYTDPTGQLSVTYRLAVGPDGNVWVTGSGYNDNNGNAASYLARITPGGTWTDYELPDDGTGALSYGIASDPTGDNLWFTIKGRGGEHVPDGLGRFHI